MGSVVRELASDSQAAILQQHTRPVCLVKIVFDTGPVFLSETATVVWGSDTYLESSVKVGQFTWTPDAEQAGDIQLINERSAASAVVLNNAVQGSSVYIYQTYLEGVSFTTPELLITGVLDGATIGADVTTLAVLTSSVSTEFVPNRFFSPETGFANLPVVGTLITWGTERYVLEAED